MKCSRIQEHDNIIYIILKFCLNIKLHINIKDVNVYKNMLLKGELMFDSVNSIFGIPFQIEKINSIKGLPVSMSSNRTFYKFTNEESSFLLVKLSESEKFGAVALKKQQKQYEEKTNMFVAYWFEFVTRAQRDSLIKHHIAFIAGDKQLYLPFLGAALENSFRKKQEIQSEKMMPVTQSLFLYLLYECSNQKVMKKQAAEYLNVTRTSITRASEQLEKMGLISQEMNGKECYMWTAASGYELFQKAKKYLINPVQKIYMTENCTAIQAMPVAGESALAMQSMINPSRIECFAMDKSLEKEYSFEKLDERWEEYKKLVQVEFWKYDPKKFSKNNMVDVVSLYMSLKDVKDERIEEALDEMMEEYEW